jgi:hypothetical protein
MVLGLTGILGLAILVIGWFGSSGTAQWSHQIAWTVVAGIGVMIGGLGATSWLLGGFRAVRSRSSSLAHLIALHLRTPPEPPEGRPDSLVIVVGAGSLLHAPACPFVAGKAVRAPSPADFEQLFRCRACAR